MSTSMTDHHLRRIASQLSGLGCVLPLFFGVAVGTLISLMGIGSALRDIAEDMHRQTLVQPIEAQLPIESIICDECDCEPPGPDVVLPPECVP